MQASILAALLIFSSVCQTRSSERPTSRDDRADELIIQASVRDLAAADLVLVNEAIDRLQNLPSIAVITVVATELDRNAAFTDSNVRDRAYGILMDHRAAAYDVGFALLLRELQRPEGKRLLPAFALTPPENHPRLVKAITPLLANADTSRYEISQVLNLLAMTGPIARGTLPEILALWSAKFDASESAIDLVTFRMSIAAAMLHVGGPDWALDRFGVQNPSEHKREDMLPILLAMAKVGGETEGTWNVEKTRRDRVREFLIRALKHKDVDVRKQAITALGHAYSKSELVLKDATGEYRINPELDKAMRELMQGDADPELRRISSQVVQEWFPMHIRKQREKDAERPS